MPQIVVYESDSRLKLQLEPLIEQRRWVLREVRRPDVCLRCLARGGPAVLVIRAGGDLDRELNLLERATWLYPDAPAVLVADGDQPELAGLAWDLGAACVLLPPQPRERLSEIVAALMGAEVEAK